MQLSTLLKIMRAQKRYATCKIEELDVFTRESPTAQSKLVLTWEYTDQINDRIVTRTHSEIINECNINADRQQFKRCMRNAKNKMRGYDE